MIALERVSIAFGRNAARVQAVRQVSFSVPRGAAFGLVGESGSGKSTVLRAIAGVIAAQSGDIWLDGQNAAGPRNRAQRKLVQMVFQDPYGSLHPSHTVDRILAEPLVIHRFDQPDRRIAQMLSDVGLGPEHRFRFPHQLSGGQRQRVAIARALILEPSILLLDEPTSALDVSVQAEILNLLSRLRASHHLTVLMVSHDLAVIAHLCERLAIMRAGEMVEQVDVEDLVRGRVQAQYSRELLASSRAWTLAERPSEMAAAPLPPIQAGRGKLQGCSTL